MNPTVTHAPRNAMLLGIAATLAGVGALLWRTTRHKGVPRALHATPLKPRGGNVPVWAQASAIVASSASALLLLLREKA